jgi:hypothetical protein
MAASNPFESAARRATTSAATPTAVEPTAANASVARSPTLGIAHTASPIPATDPSVLAPTIQPARRGESAGSRELARNSAGSVPPSSTVAGSRLPPASQSAGADPRSMRPLASAASGISVAAARAPAPISSAAYQRNGEAVRSARGPRNRAPSASPPKKATSTAEMASTWLPAASATRRVHTT